VKHDGRLVMIWECMMAFGPRPWYIIEGRMDRHLYKFILENFLWSTIWNYNLDLSRLVFQYDNDPKHTSKIVQE
jgi:ERCC4-type nuclease